MRGSAKDDETTGNEADLKSLVRNPRKFDIPLEDLLQNEDIYCDICFRIHDKKCDRKTPEYDPAMRFMWCYGCFTSVHLVCHGIDTPHEDIITDHKDEVTMFVCDRCRYLSSFNKPNCAVCKLQGGLQRKTTDSKWVHIVCALYSDEWTVYDFKTMEIGPEIEKDRPGKKTRSQRKKCDYCKGGDNVVQCFNPDCGLYSHFYCALKNKVPYLLQDEETRSGWTPYFETIKVEDIWASFEADEKLKHEVFELYKQCEKTINGLEEPEPLKNENSMVEETKHETGNNKKKGGAAAKKKGTKKAGDSSQAEEKAEKEEVKMDIEEPANPEAADDPLFIELYEKLQARLAEMLAKRTKSSNLRGGRVYFECPMHRSEDLFCLCKKPYDPNIFMIRCDCCANWFHSTCVGVAPEEGEALPEYFCQSCREWYRYKLTSLSPSTEHMDVEIDPAKLVPSYVYRFYISDLIETAVILEKKVETMVVSQPDLLEAAKRLPLNIQGIIAMSFRKAILKEATDLIISFLIEKKEDEFAILSIYDSAHNKIDEEVLKQNVETMEKLQRINQIYTKNNVQCSKIQETLEKKSAKLNWLKSFADVLTRKSTFEEVKSLIEEADKEGMSNSPEKQHLESMIQAAQSFFNQQKKVLEEKADNINHSSDSLQSEFDRVDKCENFETAEKLFSRAITSAKELIQKKLSLAELEALAERGKHLEIDFLEVTSELEAEIQRVKNWQSLTQPGKISEFIEYIREMCSLSAFLPEMLQKLDLFEKCKTLHLRLLYFLKAAESSTQKKEKGATSAKADTMVDESEETNEAPKGIKLHLQEAKELKETIENQELTFEDEFQQLKDKIKHCENLQQKLQKHLDVQLDPALLKSLQKDADKAAFTFKELEDIQHKINIYHELTTISKKTALLSAMEEKLELGKTMFKPDASIFSDIEAKIGKGKALQERANELLAQKEFSKEDISEKAQAIINDIKAAKIEIPQKETLISLEKSYKWMEKFYNFWQKKQPAIPYDTMEIETTKSNLKGKEPFTLDHSCRVCLNSSVFESDWNKYGQDLSQTVKNGQGIEHSDVRIREVFYKYAQLVWNKEAAFALSKISITPKELQTLVETAQLYQIHEKNPTLSELKKIEAEYQEVLDSFQKFKNSDEFANLVEQTNTEELSSKIKELRTKLQEVRVRNDDVIQTIANANLIIEWVIKARTIQKLHEQGKRLNYQSLKEILHMGSLCKTPSDNKLFLFIRNLLDSLSAVMDQYNKYKKSQSEFNEALKSVNQTQDEKAKKKLLMGASQKRPTVSECKRLLEAIKTSNISIEPSEIEKMESDLYAAEEWQKELQSFLEANKLDTSTYNLTPEKATAISGKLNPLKNQLKLLQLQIEDADEKLFIYEWNFHALAKLSNSGDKHKGGFKEWTNLIKKADAVKPRHPELHQSNLYKDLNEQIQFSSKLSAQINEYRAVEEKLSTMVKATSHSKIDQLVQFRKELKTSTDLKKLYDEIAACKIEMTEEKRYIQDILTNGKKALELYNQLCMENAEKGIKEPLKTFLTLQDIFRKLPISHGNEERNLNQLIQKAQSFQKALEDCKRQSKDGKLVFYLIKLAVEQYMQSPIAIKEAEAIQKEYTKSKEIMDEVSKKAEQLRKGNELDFSEVRLLTQRIDEINLDMGEELEDLKCEVWNLQVDSIRKNEESFDRGASEVPKITYSVLKALLAEGYSLLVSKNAIAKLRENIIYAEQLLLKAEAELRDLYNIKNVEILEAFHSSHQSFVDIKEEIIEYKVQLGLDPSHQAAVESQVKNIFQNSDEQIISMLKAEKALTAGNSDQASGSEATVKSKKDKKLAGNESLEKKPKPIQRERRKINPSKQLMDDSFQYEHKFSRMSPEDSPNKDDGDWNLKKKVKLDSSGQSADKVIEKSKKDKKVPPPETKPKKVTEDVRQENRKKFGETIKQNTYFGSLSEEQIKKYSKDIEVNLFSEYHENYAKYMHKSEKIRTFFDKAKKFKALSKMILSKQFAIEVLNDLAKADDSKLSEFDQKAERLKAKKAKQAAAAKSTTASQIDDLKMLLGEKTQEQAPSRFQSLVTQPRKEPERKEVPTTLNNRLEPLSPEEDKSKHPQTSKFSDEPAAFSDEEADNRLQREVSKSKNLTGDLEMEEIHPEEGLSKSKKEAILFDPDEEEGEPAKKITAPTSSYNPFSVDLYNPVVPEPYYKAETEEVDYPKGSVLKIFEGPFKNTIKKKSTQVLDGLMLLTTDDCKLVRLFPRLPDEIKGEGRVPSYEAIKYLEECMKRNDKKIRIIKGWVICTSSETVNFERIAEDLLAKNKFLGFKYSDYAGSYFFHPQQPMERSMLKLTPKVRKLVDYPDAKPILYFVIYERKLGFFKPNINGEAFNPVLMQVVEEPPSENIEIEKKVQDKNQESGGDGYSPITSDEENAAAPKAKDDKMSIEAEGERNLADVNVDEIMDVVEEVKEAGLFSVQPQPHSQAPTTSGISNVSPDKNYNPQGPLETTSLLNLDTKALVEKLQNMPREQLVTYVSTISEEDKGRIIEALNAMVDVEAQPEVKPESNIATGGESYGITTQPGEGPMQLNPMMNYAMSFPNPSMGMMGRTATTPGMHPLQYGGEGMQSYQGYPGMIPGGPTQGMTGSGRGSGGHRFSDSRPTTGGSKDRNFNRDNRDYRESSRHSGYHHRSSGSQHSRGGTSKSGPKNYHG